MAGWERNCGRCDGDEKWGLKYEIGGARGEGEGEKVMLSM
jgi:hypothetical protein